MSSRNECISLVALKSSACPRRIKAVPLLFGSIDFRDDVKQRFTLGVQGRDSFPPDFFMSTYILHVPTICETADSLVV